MRSATTEGSLPGLEKEEIVWDSGGCSVWGGRRNVFGIDASFVRNSAFLDQDGRCGRPEVCSPKRPVQACDHSDSYSVIPIPNDSNVSTAPFRTFACESGKSAPDSRAGAIPSSSRGGTKSTSTPWATMSWMSETCLGV